MGLVPIHGLLIKFFSGEICLSGLLLREVFKEEFLNLKGFSQWTICKKFSIESPSKEDLINRFYWRRFFEIPSSVATILKCIFFRRLCRGASPLKLLFWAIRALRGLLSREGSSSKKKRDLKGLLTTKDL